MPEYKSKEIGESESAQDNEQEFIKEVAAKERAVLTSDDVRKGGSIHSTAAFWNDLVIFGSADKHVYALNKRTGELVWKFLTGDSVASSPFVENGIIYIGSYDGHMYALNANDGTEMWRYNTGDVVFSSPIVANGIVYFGSFNGYEYALRADNGNLVWKYQTGSMIETAAAVVNNTVIVDSDDFCVYSLDTATGRLRWKVRVTGPPTQMSIAKYNGQVLSSTAHRTHVRTSEPTIVCLGTWIAGNIFLLDTHTGKQIACHRAVCENPDQPMMHNGILYFGSINGDFHAFDVKEGRVLWKFRTGNMVTASSCINNGTIYFTSSDQHLYALRLADGAPLWKYCTDGVITATPVMDEKVIFFGSWDTYFYAIDAEKQQLLWKFKAGATPSKPSFIEDISAIARIKRSIVRWWKPEAPRLTVYETKPVQSSTATSAYKMSELYKSDTKYAMQGPAGYETAQKKKDWRDQLLGRR